MAPPRITDEKLREAVAVYNAHNRNLTNAAAATGLARSTFQSQIREAANRGFLLDHPPAMPGFRIAQVTTAPDGSQHIQQKPEHGDQFELPAGHRIKGVSTLVNADGGKIIEWIKTTEDSAAAAAAMAATVAALKESLPRAERVLPIPPSNEALLSQYTITDLHLGMLAWGEETRSADWDLQIAEKLIIDWFAAAIAQSPASALAVLAQLGDLLHHDAKVSVTPGHGHVLDADSRLQKMIRVAIRVIRQIVRMLLEKHGRVHVIMADANHDEAGGSWLRELFAALYEDEPRVTVETSPSTYVAVEHGLTSLFYHHGHKKKTAEVDRVFAGMFRELFGRTKFSYAHTGHKHSDELKTTNIMKVEQHETLAPPDNFGSNWLSNRSAKVITYHKQFGEVGRITLTPEMVTGAAAA